MTTPAVSEISGYMEAFQQAFAGAEHRRFHQQGGRPGALLIHGLVGTPAEMRPLADVLVEAGWTVEAPLLPGHGVEIDRLFEAQAEAWVAQARGALHALQAEHNPILVVGHSMGAAVSLRIVAELAPEARTRVCSGLPRVCSGLILISPFVRLPLDNVLLRALSPLLRMVIPRMRPFKNLDFDSGPNSAEMRKGIREFMPDLDLDDPEVQARIRQMTIPTRLLGELEKLGKSARQAARQIDIPTLILQGTEDEVARPATTRELLVSMGGPVSYHEFAAAHNLVRAEGPAWAEVAAAVRAFGKQAFGNQALEGAGSTDATHVPVTERSGDL